MMYIVCLAGFFPGTLDVWLTIVNVYIFVENLSMATKYDMYDSAFLGILQNEGNIATFLDAVFSFLSRR